MGALEDDFPVSGKKGTPLDNDFPVPSISPIDEDFPIKKKKEKKGLARKATEWFFNPLPGVKETMERGGEAGKSIWGEVPSQGTDTVGFVPEKELEAMRNEESAVKTFGSQPARAMPFKTVVKAPTGKGGQIVSVPPSPLSQPVPLSAAVAEPLYSAVSANTEANLSPFGIVTTPIRIIPGVGPIASKFLKTALGGDTIAGIGATQAVKRVGQLGGVIGDTSIAQKVGQAGKEFATEKLPNLTNIYHRTIYPKSLSFINAVMGKKVSAERQGIIEEGGEIFNKLPPLEQQKVLTAMRNTAEERALIGKKMHEDASVLPVEQYLTPETVPSWMEVANPGKTRTEIAMVENLQRRVKFLEGKEAATKAGGQTLSQFMAELPKEVNNLVSIRAKSKGLSILSDESKQFAEDIYARHERAMDRYINSGMAPQEAFSITGDIYSPAFYADKKITLGPLFEHPRVAGRAELERLREKELLTSKGRVAAGEVESLPYNVMRSRAQNTWDSIVGEWAQDIASRAELAASVDNVLATPAKYVGWAQVKNKGYGVLDGMFVHPSVKAEMDGLWHAGTQKGTLTGWIMDTIGKGMSRFRRGVTIWNAPTHFGNNVSNPIQVSLVDVPIAGKEVTESWARFNQSDPFYKMMQSGGVVSPGFMRGKEIRNLIKKAQKESADSSVGAKNALDNFTRAITQGGKGVRPLSEIPGAMYQGSEEFWKFHTARYAFERGVPEMGVVKGDIGAAIDLAEKAVLNYQEVPLTVREIRSGPLGAFITPFITYSYKITPLVLDTMLKRPWKFMQWKAALEAYNAGVRSATGISEDEWENYKQAKMESADGEMDKLFLSLYPEVIMPFRGPKGQIMVMGAARLTPWGQMIDPRGFGLFGPLGGPIANAVMPGTARGSFATRGLEPGVASDIEGVGNLISPSPGARRAGQIVSSGLALLPGGATTGKAIMAGVGALPETRGDYGEAKDNLTWVKDSLGAKNYTGTKLYESPIGVPQRVSQFTMGTIKPVSAEEERFKTLRKDISKMYGTAGGARAQYGQSLGGERAGEAGSFTTIQDAPWKERRPTIGEALQDQRKAVGSPD